MQSERHNNANSVDDDTSFSRVAHNDDHDGEKQHDDAVTVNYQEQTNTRPYPECVPT